MKTFIIALAWISFFVLIDLYVFKGIKLLTSTIPKQILKTSIHFTYWSITLITVGSILYFTANYEKIALTRSYGPLQTIFGLIILFLVPKLIFAFFHLLDDIGVFTMSIFQRLSPPKEIESISESVKISRGAFLTKVGLFLATIPFLGILYGMIRGRYDFRVINQEIAFENLPDAFDGFTIAHISDIHIGSFDHYYEPVQRGINMVNDLGADAIFFTGDLVNNYSEELNGWENILSQLKAKHGVFSVLGNHDYGDYVSWKSNEEKRMNLETLKFKQKNLGFQLLINQNVEIKKGDSSIALIGVENWGTGGFAQYGRLDKAMENVNPSGFKILLSHDPSHWDAEVLPKTNIDLTLSGHTHGMQFGIEIPGFKWSPIQFRYPRWAGLYNKEKQFIYVNRGFGYLAFPARVGISPEITLITLRKKQ
jgi:uncharacterized protein